MRCLQLDKTKLAIEKMYGQSENAVDIYLWGIIKKCKSVLNFVKCVISDFLTSVYFLNSFSEKIEDILLENCLNQYFVLFSEC